MVKLTSVLWRVLGTNRIFGTWHWSLGGNVTLRENYFEEKFINVSLTVHFLTLIHINYSDIMWTILIYIKNETLIETKTSLINLFQRTIRLSDFFQYSLVLIPKRKCLVGGSWIRCGESGTPWTIIYTRWSSWHDGLGCHAAMVASLWDWRAPPKHCYRGTCRFVALVSQLRGPVGSLDGCLWILGRGPSALLHRDGDASSSHRMARPMYSGIRRMPRKFKKLLYNDYVDRFAYNPYCMEWAGRPRLSRPCPSGVPPNQE